MGILLMVRFKGDSWFIISRILFGRKKRAMPVARRAALTNFTLSCSFVFQSFAGYAKKLGETRSEKDFHFYPYRGRTMGTEDSGFCFFLRIAPSSGICRCSTSLLVCHPDARTVWRQTMRLQMLPQVSRTMVRIAGLKDSASRFLLRVGPRFAITLN